MLRIYEVTGKLDGFLFKHLPYEALVKFVEDDPRILYVPDAQFPEELQGSLSSIAYWYKDKFVIAISERVETVNSKWYKLAHELGHYFLHPREYAPYVVDLKSGEFKDVRHTVPFGNIVEAEANIFSKLTFLPLEFVRTRMESCNLWEEPVPESLVTEVLDWCMERFREPKPQTIEKLKSKVACMLESYCVLLALQNVLDIHCIEMNGFLDSKKVNDAFECPRYLFSR